MDRRQAVAEDLRLRGNDAFGTKDWERANALYKDSVAAWPTAKAYANQAATLCKMGRYPEAARAAERATDVGPRWAKAWWRRGVTAELRKQFTHALNHYEMAVRLAPKEKSFRLALQAMRQRLKVSGKTANGLAIVDLPESAAADQDNPAIRAFWRARQAMGDDEPVATTVETNEQLEVEAAGGTSTNVQARNEFQRLMSRPWSSPKEYHLAVERLVGGIPSGRDASYIASGITHLNGHNIVLEMGETHGSRRSQRQYMCPQPRYLSRYVPYQMLAIVHSVDTLFQMQVYKYKFPRDMVCGKAVIDAVSAFYGNTQIKCPHTPRTQDPTPQEAVDYMKAQLRTGAKTWEHGIRQYVSMQYRGTLLFSYVLRLVGQFALAYEADDWAHKFINLADEEFQVSRREHIRKKELPLPQAFVLVFLLAKFASMLIYGPSEPRKWLHPGCTSSSR